MYWDVCYLEHEGPKIFYLFKLPSLWHILVISMLYVWQTTSAHHLHSLSSMKRINVTMGKVTYGLMQFYISLNTLLYLHVTNHLIWCMSMQTEVKTKMQNPLRSRTILKLIVESCLLKFSKSVCLCIWG